MQLRELHGLIGAVSTSLFGPDYLFFAVSCTSLQFFFLSLRELAIRVVRFRGCQGRGYHELTSATALPLLLLRVS